MFTFDDYDGCDGYELSACSVTVLFFGIFMNESSFFSALNDSCTLLFRPLSVYEGAHMVSRGSIVGGDIVLSTRRDMGYPLRDMAVI